jgi:signal transduction histidine kinase
MLVIASPRAKALTAGLWFVFAAVNSWLMYVVPGNETIPYHLIWVSFVLLYGLAEWPLRASVVVFGLIVVVTGVPLVKHARDGYIGWEESSEIVLMGVIAALLMWHVRRSQAAQRRLAALRESDRASAELRELTTRFGSHELRTRLTIARSALELIRTTSGDSQADRDAELAIGELDKALTTATNLLTLVRVDGPPRVTVVEVPSMIAELERRWTIRADRAWEFTAETFTVEADPDRMEAALDCLIENAVKFTEEYDEIRVSARVDGADVVFVVADSGAGIPADDLDRIIEPFETSSAAGARAGSGLGLAIVRAVAEARGGSVTARSTLGVGTEVEMRSPLLPARSAPATGSSRPVAPPAMTEFGSLVPEVG